jgi:chemotaxis protein CheD
MKKTLNINDIDVTSRNMIYTCYGLGSCIGLFVTDRITGLSGGAHIPMPAPNGGEFLDAGCMLNALLNEFKARGSQLLGLRAKLTGGAQVYASALNIGEQNVRAVVNLLVEQKIYIAASDVGGVVSRTARYNTLTGDLNITTSEPKNYCI